VRGKSLFQLLFFLSAATLGLFNNSFAVPAAPDVFRIVQSDGTVLNAVARGDEWNNSIETIDGYSIHKDIDGFWYYISHYDKGSPVVSRARADKLPPAFINRGIRPDRKYLRAPGGEGRFNSLKSSSINAPLSYASDTGGETVVQTAPASGTFRVIYILAEFTDQAGTYSEESFASFIADNINDYFDRASYGNVTLSPAEESYGTADNGVIGWVNLGYAHPDTGGNTDERNRQLTRDAIIAADPYINYSAFDSNGDHYVDSDELAVVVIVAGYERSYSASYTPTVWGHTWSLGWGSVQAPVVDGVRVGDGHGGRGGYAQFGEKHRGSISDQHQATMGIMAHEIGHLIYALPDLYDTDGSSEGIGAFGLMGSGSWGKALSEAYSGQTPVLPCAWSRKYLGWINVSPGAGATSIIAAGSDSATSINSAYILTTSLPNEYFMVENRQPLGYDRGLERWLGANFGGLAIWHIDENTILNNISSNFVNSSECYPGGPSCSADHFGVALMQADGSWDLEKNINRGTRTDLWYLGNAAIFDSASVPDSDLYNGYPSMVSVVNISAPGSVMTSIFAVQAYVLTTSVIPAGSGSITPDCSAGCLYDSGTAVVLTSTAYSGYFFHNWTGCDSASNNVCTVIPDANDTVTANFQTCYQPVRIDGTPYLTLQDAYDAAVDGDIIQTRIVVFPDDLNATRNISVTLEGGFNCNYSAVAGKSIFNGTMTVSDGIITAGDFIFGN
jgi:M6 family metalloprotease-like protein